MPGAVVSRGGGRATSGRRLPEGGLGFPGWGPAGSADCPGGPERQASLLIVNLPPHLIIQICIDDYIIAVPIIQQQTRTARRFDGSKREASPVAATRRSQSGGNTGSLVECRNPQD